MNARKGKKRSGEMSGDYAEQYRGKRAPALLRDLLGRIHETLNEGSRDDLVDFLYLIEEQLLKRPDDLRDLRKRMVEIASSDDFLVGTVRFLEQHERTKGQAREIPLKASILNSWRSLDGPWSGGR